MNTPTVDPTATHPYLCGDCGHTGTLTIAQMTAHWREHQTNA